MEILVEKHVNSALLIDDDPSCNFILSEFINLVNKSIKKSSAFSVDESLEILETIISFPDVIYLDLNMPIKSGFDFLEHYEKKYFPLYPHTKIYVLTSSLRPSDKEKTLSFACVTDYKSKSEIDQFIEDSLRFSEA